MKLQCRSVATYFEHSLDITQPSARWHNGLTDLASEKYQLLRHQDVR
tara:strand:+ start:384 stop:524 length:141 start_codon:yes stop_codon:yes gene_type:complete